MCPICLSRQRAPRITKCGHSTCLPCILHYFSVNERPFARCVLCSESVYAPDLRCLTFDVHRGTRIGDTVRFVLCRRPKASAEVFPALEEDSNDSTGSSQDNPFRFQSVVVGMDIVPVLEADRADIIAAFQSADAMEVPFLEVALQSIDEGLSSARNRPSAPPTHRRDMSSQSDDYLFFQAADGQSVYLGSLGWRILLREFGSPERLPPSFTASIVDITHFRQNDDTRMRFRFLSHLALTSNFSVCEANLKSIVSKDTLRAFHDEISQRKRARARIKAIQMREDEKMAAAAEARRLEWNTGRPVADLSSAGSSANPFGFASGNLGASDDHFGPAIGNRTTSAAPSGSSWSAVADRGLNATSTWEPLPSRTLADAASPPLRSWPVRPSAVSASPPMWPAAERSAPPRGTPKKKTTLFSNAMARRRFE